MTNTTREQRLRELCVRWRGRGVKGGSSDVCADELAAILNEPMRVTEELYRNVCESLEGWKRRAIESEEALERMRLEESQTHMSEPVFCTHEWELVSTKGGSMDHCKICQKHRWHRPIHHAPDCNVNMADISQRLKGCDCGARKEPGQ